MKLFAFGAFIALALLGAVFFFAARRGWKRNGYFSLPSVVLIVLGLFIAFQGLDSGITLAAVGIHMEDHPIAALTIGGLAEIAVMLVGTVLISRTARQNLFAVFRLEGFYETPPLAYLLAVPVILASQIAGEAISTLIERAWKIFPDLYRAIDKYETANDKVLEGLVTAHGSLEFLLILFFVAIVPAFAEETLFRGFAQTNIERSGHRHARPYVALFATSLLFAMVHASIFKLPGLFMLGLALGWMAYRTNNLFTGALAHAMNNGWIVVMLYLSPHELTAKANSALVGPVSTTDALIMFVLIAPILALLLYFFGRVTAPLSARNNAERELQEQLAENAGFWDEDHTDHKHSTNGDE